MDTRVPRLIQPLLTEYLDLTEKEVPGLIDAFYLQGSVALDAFNPHLSDVDFVAVLNHPASAVDLRQLSQIHQTIAAKYPLWALARFRNLMSSNSSRVAVGM